MKVPVERGERGLEAGRTLRVPPRIVTAAALFDGHDAAIHVVRRILVALGAEVVHLGHNRSAVEIARAVDEEDAHAVAVSSYQGGHMEFFPYLRALLDDRGRSDVVLVGGGGGVILPEEARELERRGVEKIFTPEDGRRLGLEGMGRRIADKARDVLERRGLQEAATPDACDPSSVARALSALEAGLPLETFNLGERRAPAVGVTGPGGAGKSSLVDELILRLVRSFPDLPVAVLAVDPSRRRSGGALLGDRLRMNSIYCDRVFFRSMATRGGREELAPAAAQAVELLRRAGYELVIVETAGAGQGASGIVDVADLAVYVMTPDFGSPTQLEKIDMLEHAALVAVNKADRRGGAADAVREVERCVRRYARGDPAPVIPTSAARFNDPGVTRLLRALVERLGALGAAWADPDRVGDPGPAAPVERLVPPERENYLSAIAASVRRYRARVEEEAECYRRYAEARAALRFLESEGAMPAELLEKVRERVSELEGKARSALEALDEFAQVRERYKGEELEYEVRGRPVRGTLRRRTLSGLSIPRIALPEGLEGADLLRYVRLENLPGRFPYTAGVYPLKREDELPTRQFAGEGTPERTNRRFHYLTRHSEAKRLSVAFDSVTLYGADPDERPDIYGKIGESGVSIATLDDMKKLFAGFDLASPSTSVSMTINGPAATILAMFFNAAIDQQIDRFRERLGREPSAEERARIRADTLRRVRGTVQADILKEDQAQNTCIFSVPFSLRLMADTQEFFIREGVRNFYSVSISGYHIAEAGANPITQLAFTLANAFTYLEYYRARGMDVDDFVRNFSFFFSNGLDAEYAVLGRVARRIWAIALRDIYGAGERSQKLKYHIQTSGRSLHAREYAFNDIRTTLQALMAIYDHCNSLHTNAYDEAFTTPTEESVRRALAIQLIIQKELGTAKNENPLQGSFLIGELTRLVEDAVLEEFERLSERGGVLGAMETGYMRGRIQDESLRYEELKERGEIEIVGVNTFLAEGEVPLAPRKAVRASKEEKDAQIRNLREFQKRHAAEAPAALERLKKTAVEGGNIFAELMETVRVASLGQITRALFEVGGQYRRSL